MAKALRLGSPCSSILTLPPTLSYHGEHIPILGRQGTPVEVSLSPIEGVTTP